MEKIFVIKFLSNKKIFLSLFTLRSTNRKEKRQTRKSRKFSYESFKEKLQ